MGANECDRQERLDALSSVLSVRFRTLSFIYLLLSPFILCYLILECILENGEQWRNRPQATMAVRNWCNEARWKFRDYNELPHLFRRRLARAYSPAVQYVANFTSPTVTVLAKLLSYLSGSVVFVRLFSTVSVKLRN